MSVFICNKDTLAVLDKYLVVFYVSNRVSCKNYFANKLIRWFVFEAVQKTRNRCFIGSKTDTRLSPRVLNPMKHCCSVY